MRASVNDQYGSPDVLAIRDIPTPQPADGEIQVRIRAATVGRTDTCALRAHPFFVRLIAGLLRPTGVFAATDLGPWWQNIVLALWSSITGSGRVVFPTPRADRTLVEFLRDRLEANDLRSVVDRTYPLEDIADAYRYVETQQKIGIVVINVAPGPLKSYAI